MYEQQSSPEPPPTRPLPDLPTEPIPMPPPVDPPTPIPVSPPNVGGEPTPS